MVPFNTTVASRGRVVIAGGSGFLGVSLAHALTEQGFEPVCLSRSRPPATSPGTWRSWDGRTVGEWVAELEGAAALVNLAGRSVDCRKTPDHCDEILRSRVESTRVLGEACGELNAPPPVWVQMSTAHIYGDPPTAICTESSAFGYGLAPDVGRAWEAAFAASKRPSQRGIVLRTSFVVGRDRGAGRGAMGRLVPLARFGLGGRVGHGRQGFSWLHEADFHAIVQRAIDEPAMEGAYIVSSPQPVSQADFMRALRHAVGMPVGLPTPAWAVRVGAATLLNTDPGLALYGRYVRPQRLLDDGFPFRFPTLPEALADVVGPAAERSDRSERSHG